MVWVPERGYGSVEETKKVRAMRDRAGLVSGGRRGCRQRIVNDSGDGELAL